MCTAVADRMKFATNVENGDLDTVDVETVALAFGNIVDFGDLREVVSGFEAVVFGGF